MQRQTRPAPTGHRLHHDAMFACTVIGGAVAVSLLVWFLIGLVALLARMV